MPFSNRVANEYCVLFKAPLCVESVPCPFLRSPCQTADAVRFIIWVLCGETASKIILLLVKRLLSLILNQPIERDNAENRRSSRTVESRTRSFRGRAHRGDAVDPPGLGDSAPPADGQYDTASVANILHQLVLKLGLSKIIYVGHDVGVWIGYNYGALYGSEGVAHLTVHTPGSFRQSAVQADPWDPIWVTRSWHFFFNQLENLPEQLTAGHEREYLTWWFRSKALRPECFTDQEIEAYYHEYSRPNRLTPGWADYRAIPRTAKINRQFATKPLAMPVLAIGGSNSAGLNLARGLAQSTPDVGGEVIAESGHLVPEEQPERTAAVLFGALSAANL